MFSRNEVSEMVETLWAGAFNLERRAQEEGGVNALRLIEAARRVRESCAEIGLEYTPMSEDENRLDR